MPVPDAHPDALKLDEAFAAAMNTPGKPREPGPPPETDKEAPFGRDDSGTPLTPFGLRKDGSPRLSPAGRRPAEERPRVVGGATPPAGDGRADKKDGKKPGSAIEPRRYAPAIAETLEVVWLGGTAVATVAPDLPVVGKLVPAVQVQAQAAVILTYKDNIAGALDLCAQHNESARRLAEKFQTGNAGWALNALFMMLPVVSTSVQVWGKQEREVNPETGQELPTLAEQLAEQNARSFREYMERLAQQAQEAQAQPVPEAA